MLKHILCCSVIYIYIYIYTVLMSVAQFWRCGRKRSLAFIKYNQTGVHILPYYEQEPFFHEEVHISFHVTIQCSWYERKQILHETTQNKFCGTS